MDKKPPKMHFKTSQQTDEKEKPVTAGQAIKRGSFGRTGLASTIPATPEVTPVFQTTNCGTARSGSALSAKNKKRGKKSITAFGIPSIRKRTPLSDESEDEEKDASDRVSQRSSFTHLSKKKNSDPRMQFKSTQTTSKTAGGVRGGGISGRDDSYRVEYLKKQKLEKKEVEARVLEERKIAEEKREKKKEVDARARALFLQEQMFMWKSKIDTKEFAPEVIAEQIRLVEMEYFSIDQRFRPW
jgi:hypothetical protein